MIITLSGYHANPERKEIANPEQGRAFDYIFAGETEHTFHQLLNGESLENIPGLPFNHHGK